MVIVSMFLLALVSVKCTKHAKLITKCQTHLQSDVMIMNEYAETRRLLDHLTRENNLLKSRLVEIDEENAKLQGQLGKLRGDAQMEPADAALEAFEQRILNRRQRKSPTDNNPFLATLGSKYMATRSLLQPDDEPLGTVYGKKQSSFSNKHPLRESCRRRGRREASSQLKKDLVQVKQYLMDFVGKLSVWHVPACSVLMLLFTLIVLPGLIHWLSYLGDWEPL